MLFDLGQNRKTKEHGQMLLLFPRDRKHLLNHPPFFFLSFNFFLNDGRVNIFFFLKKQTKKSVNKKAQRGNLQNKMESLFKVQGPSWVAGGLQVTAVATVFQTAE